MVNLYQVLSIGLALASSTCRAQERNITIVQPCPGLNLQHSVAVGSKDSLHYFVSNVDVPSLLIARTAIGAEASVNCESFNSSFKKLFENSISIDSPSYVYTLQFTRLFEYQDIEDNVQLPDCTANTSCIAHELRKINWQSTAVVGNVITFTSNINSDKLHFLPNGSLSISIQIFGENSRMDVSPHLKLTPNMTIVTLALDRLNVSYDESRFSLEFVAVTSDSASDQSIIPSSVTEARSVDDEYSPGIFVENNWVVGNNTAYMQWKPVAYLSAERTLGVKSVTKVSFRNPVASFAGDVMMSTSRSLAMAYFGSALDHQLVSAMNVSFGKKGDKFYSEHNYTVWAVSVGLGEAYVETISLQMILVIAIGIGIPIVLLIVGFLLIAIRRCRSTAGYENIASSSVYGSIQT